MVTVGKRNFKNIEQWQVDYIKEHYQEKLTDIGDVVGLAYQRVDDVIKALGLKRERHWKIYLPKTKEVEEKLLNPYLSHVEIAREYGVTETCVAKRRKELSVKVRRKNYDTLIEQDVESLLRELDLAYIKQKRIGKWSIDFYLGRKYCVDVHGEWSHSKDKVKERDSRKIKDLENEGYKYLVIHEKELQDINGVREKIKDFTLGFPQ